ncbi:MAG: hypothetical protein QW468_03560 [Candidatus Bathyarchaeia archaeon]
MLGERKHTVLLGLAFLFFLIVSTVENNLFFNIADNIFQNPLLAVAMFFIHNVLVVSLILLGMTFCINLVLTNFFKREKYGNIVLEHPRIFALVFAIIIIFLSVLRGGSLLGGIKIETFL